LRTEVLPRDRESIRRLVGLTGFFHADEVDIAVELVDEHLARGPASGYHFVFADKDGAVIGYACYGAVPCTRNSYDLYWIAVDPAFQRHGLGRALTSAAESLIAEAGGERVYIDTSGREQYASTRAFYEKNGYACEARLKDFYAPGDDRVIYSKVLDKTAVVGIDMDQ
jgi:ribosomal protein S18 acetylase RimI-like enzyme